MCLLNTIALDKLLCEDVYTFLQGNVWIHFVEALFDMWLVLSKLEKGFPVENHIILTVHIVFLMFIEFLR